MRFYGSMRFYGPAALLLLLDQAVKWAVSHVLRSHDPLPLLPNLLSLTLVANERGAFGLVAFPRPAFILLTLLIVLGFIVYHHRQGTEGRGGLRAAALGLAMGGALGNLVDRIRLGHVVDFIDFHIDGIFKWPVFNVADVGITVGLGILFLQIVMGKRHA